MHATFATLWLQVVKPLANVHETKWTPHVKRETDVAQSYTSSGLIHEFSITGSIARQPLLMADQACNCWFFLISNTFNGIIFNMEYDV